MHTSIENLYTKVLVRRVGVGTAPFSWEIVGANAGTPIFVSSDRFRSMEAAYSAGRDRLAEFLPPRPAKRERSRAPRVSTPETTWHEDWQAAAEDEDDTDFEADLDLDDELATSGDSEPCPAMPEDGHTEA